MKQLGTVVPDYTALGYNTFLPALRQYSPFPGLDKKIDHKQQNLTARTCKNCANRVQMKYYKYHRRIHSATWVKRGRGRGRGKGWGLGPWLRVKTPEHSRQRLPIPKATSQASYSFWKLAVDELKLVESSLQQQHPPHKYHDSSQKAAWLKGSRGQ